MRRAILHELCQPLDPAEPPPAYKLQAVTVPSSTRRHGATSPPRGKSSIASRQDVDSPAAAAPETPSLHDNAAIEVLTSPSQSS